MSAKLLICAAGLAMAITGVARASTTPTQYSHVGDVLHDGYGYADMYVSNHTSYGRWQRPDSGLEIDIWNKNLMYNGQSCTTWSDWPRFYDDCDTAGTSDPGGDVFGVGTFAARSLDQNAAYHLEWLWDGYTDGNYSTEVRITWQEVRTYFCSSEREWCMNGVGGTQGAGRFVTTFWSPRTEDYKNWVF